MATRHVIKVRSEFAGRDEGQEVEFEEVGDPISVTRAVHVVQVVP